MPIKKQETAADSPRSRYNLLVAQGSIKDDAAQREVLGALEALASALSSQTKPVSGFKKWIPGLRPDTSGVKSRGIYIWGNVGRGKSMLMDLFFDHVQVTKKRRVHFHAFMQEIHARIHQLRQTTQREDSSGDPVALLALELAQETRLLCFDELQATDVADASLLYRLFSGLFSAGVIIVSTSNHPPVSLYTGGVQRERFAKFIALIEENMDVLALSSPADYRHMQLKSLQRVYFYPLGAEADAFIAGILGQICPDNALERDTFSVQGRVTHFIRYGEATGRFTFHDLCELPLGPADYLAIAKRLDTVILTGIPKLPPEKRNEAKRFVTLIDALYEHKVKLICTADSPPEGIYAEGDGAFEFNRTVSRLIEMQSGKYLQEQL